MEQFEAMVEGRDKQDMLETQTAWGLDHGPVMGLSFPDSDLREDRGLTVADPDAYPCVFCSERGESLRRRDAATLTLIEGLLRSPALTTEDELDSGWWTKECRDTRRRARRARIRRPHPVVMYIPAALRYTTSVIILQRPNELEGER